MRETSIIEVDLAAVADNVRLVRRLVGPATRVCGVVKADAYGLGGVRIAKTLVHAGVDMLAVYTPDQAAELLRAAVSGPLLVLMPVHDIGRADEVYRALICDRLHLTVHDHDHLDALIALAERFAVTIPVHLEVDTGMSRGGTVLDDAPDVLRRIAGYPRLRLAGLFTHFASAETSLALTRAQNERFERLRSECASLIPSDCIVHAGNTAATLRSPAYHKQMVRVGQAWAGYGIDSLNDDDHLPEASDLKPALIWSTRIIQLKTIASGTKVGYGSVWTARRRTRLGLLPVGYADGYPVALGSGSRKINAHVQVVLETPDGPERHPIPVVGRVSMDQITIDLTDLADELAGQGREGELHLGTPVELITADRSAPNHLTTLATAARTVPYDLLCGLSPRLTRSYHHGRASLEITSQRRSVASSAGSGAVRPDGAPASASEPPTPIDATGPAVVRVR